MRWRSATGAAANWRRNGAVWLRRGPAAKWRRLGTATTAARAEALLPKRLGPWHRSGWLFHCGTQAGTAPSARPPRDVGDGYIRTRGLVERGGLLLSAASDSDAMQRAERAVRVEIYRRRVERGERLFE